MGDKGWRVFVGPVEPNIETYVTFIHYVEGMYEAATRRIEGHYPEGADTSHQGK